jgi:exodeoxyribonuclease VII large subunit
LAARHERGIRRGLEERKIRVRAAARALPRPEEILALARQRHDTAAGRLVQALRANTQLHRGRFGKVAPRLTLNAVKHAISNDRKSLATAGQRAGSALLRLVDFKKQRLESSAKLLASLSYKSVLRRGFALVRDVKGLPVHLASAVKPAQQLTVEFADGQVNVREGSGPKQGSLL